MTESEILSATLLALGQRPDLRIWRSNTGAAKTDTGRIVRFGVKGQADISGLLRGSGRRLELEIKTDTGRQRPEQIQFQKMIEAFGGLYILARSPDQAVYAIEALKTEDAFNGR